MMIMKRVILRDTSTHKSPEHQKHQENKEHKDHKKQKEGKKYRKHKEPTDYIVSVLGRDGGYTVNYKPLPEVLKAKGYS